jgi:hypothetical protein
MFWIELRCSANKSNSCFSSRNEGPMYLSGEGTTSLAATIKAIGTKAKNNGWKKTRMGHVCPACAKEQ